LRPFKADEAYLFFGREKQTDELLRRLRVSRFLSVIGSSGSGKSSLVRCGLIPSLYGGAMSRAGSNWRIATFRPGDDPIDRLLDALTAPGILSVAGETPETSRLAIEAKLRRSALGLIDAVKLAQFPGHENLLVVVDQFEELFRFRQSRQVENPRDESIAFVKLLLEAARQAELPIYVALTMRSDFIGDCIEYPGLPEAINAGLYLVPQMSRDELRSAVSGPVAVAGGEVSQRLIQRLLNDVGVEQDQLPLLQHALMRTWDHWQAHCSDGRPMDITDYEAVGTFRDALSRHADEALEETGSDHDRIVAGKLFKALTDIFSDPRGVRRPATIGKLVQICGVGEPEVIHIVEVFRRPGRSFLMPPSDEVPKLSSRNIIDISHESLMRRWTILTKWADEESRAASFYVRRLSPTAVGFAEGTAALWRDPDLANGLRWKQENDPTAAWAEQYNNLFPEVMEFLDRSENAETERRSKEKERQRLTRIAAVAFAILSFVAIGSALLAWQANRRAEKNLNYAEYAVDDMLTAVSGPIEASETPAVAGLEDIRKHSLGRARKFYTDLDEQSADNESVRKGIAIGYLESGQMDLRSRSYNQAAADFQSAIQAFGDLQIRYSSEPDYSQKLANSQMMLAETLRMSRSDPASAEKAYGHALATQQRLVDSYPKIVSYGRELAQAHCNRGIFLSDQNRVDESKDDFDAAIKLLESLLAADSNQSDAAWDLARAYNDRAILLNGENQSSLARNDFARAISIGEGLIKKGAGSPDYQLELTKYYDGLAGLLESLDNFKEAQKAADRAQQLIDVLSTPTPSVSLEQANVYMIRGSILEPADPLGAAKEYQRSMDVLEDLKKATDPQQLESNFNQRVLDLAQVYLNLAANRWKANALIEANSAVQHVRLLLPDVPDSERVAIGHSLAELLEKMHSLPVNRN
jgi:tetratricopeptide (TPR) repeat protein/energy-coupling factor transporter ATP-binding protein EcfA2